MYGKSRKVKGRIRLTPPVLSIQNLAPILAVGLPPPFHIEQAGSIATGDVGVRVVVLRIAPMHAAQQDAQGIGTFGHGDQMHVIGHQTPAEQADAGIGQVEAKQAQVSMTIVDSRECLPSVYAALRNMVRRSRKNRPISSRHMLGYSRKCAISRRKTQEKPGPSG